MLGEKSRKWLKTDKSVQRTKVGKSEQEGKLLNEFNRCFTVNVSP